MTTSPKPHHALQGTGAVLRPGNLAGKKTAELGAAHGSKPSLPGSSHKMSRAPAPEFVSPMKATLVGQLPAGNEWLYEIKWDGYH